jgi:cytochrome c oxidase cbb3-type subunit 3
MNIRGHRMSALWGRSIATLCASVAFSACSRDAGARDDTAKVASTSPEQPAVSNVYVAGDSLRLIAHDEMLPVGFPASAKPLLIKNPYEGDKAAISTGGKLFIAYNCLDCHGADGSGAMGPSFQDGRWHFGGAPGEVFESIYQGRPDGMPSWGGRISNDQIWMLTAYVRSLSSKDLSTENFTGKTIERTGH